MPSLYPPFAWGRVSTLPRRHNASFISGVGEAVRLVTALRMIFRFLVPSRRPRHLVIMGYLGETPAMCPSGYASHVFYPPRLNACEHVDDGKRMEVAKERQSLKVSTKQCTYGSIIASVKKANLNAQTGVNEQRRRESLSLFFMYCPGRLHKAAGQSHHPCGARAFVPSYPVCVQAGLV